MHWTACLALVAMIMAGTHPIFAKDARIKSPVRMDGDPVSVADRAILRQFERGDCPRVDHAIRMEDGAIAVRCSNGQNFGIANVGGVGLVVRCSALRETEVSGCPEPSPGGDLASAGTYYFDGVKTLKFGSTPIVAESTSNRPRQTRMPKRSAETPQRARGDLPWGGLD